MLTVYTEILSDPASFLKYVETAFFFTPWILFFESTSAAETQHLKHVFTGVSGPPWEDSRHGHVPMFQEIPFSTQLKVKHTADGQDPAPLEYSTVHFS